ALEKQKQHGPEKRLIAFALDERGIPRHGYDIVDGQGKTIGVVTSGTMSPSLGIGIGLGYVPSIFSEVGSKIFVQIRKNAVPASVIKLPFYKA
ncbi:MAG: glycine cleavage T C-terminal barrel domain-containing protein, partial [Maribacter sp.]